MFGQTIATTAVRVMREDIKLVNTAMIWAGQERFSCPGCVRLGADNPARGNVFPRLQKGP
jgi:hypothetical protein